MKTRVIISILVCLLLGAAASTYAQNTEYKPTPVTISKDKVKENGRVYYSHVVLERQTLFSISKAYGVSLKDIYDSNPALNLETEGLKTFQILLIPYVEGAAKTEAAPQPAPVQSGTAATKPAPEKKEATAKTASEKKETAAKTAPARKETAAKPAADKTEAASARPSQTKKETSVKKETAANRQTTDKDVTPAAKPATEKKETAAAKPAADKTGQAAAKPAPVKKETTAPQPAVTPARPAPAAAVGSSTPTTGGDYIIHTVKWYEDLDSIAKKYGLSKEVIMKANGMTSTAVSRRQTLKIPTGSTAVAYEEEVKQNPVVIEEPEENKGILETIGEAIVEKAEELLYSGKSDITAALVLPFNAQKQPSDNNLDFYSGVLMAAKDLKAEGINVDLSVYDAVGGNIPVTEEKLAGCDVVLGPISTADLTKMLSLCPDKTPVISPLEPKAADLAAEYSNFIQAPSSNDAQCKDLINWLKDDIRHGDKVILFTEKGATRTASVSTLITELEQSGIEYTTITYGLLDGKNIAGSIEKAAPQDRTTRILVASESEAFVSDVVRNANILSHRKLDIALYALSKIRSFDTIEVEYLHNTNLHVSISYYVDYDSPAVQRFLMQYRALFNTEPGPFAFQGYDTAYNFCKLSSRYGRHWPDKLDGFKEKGLQSNFRFTRTDAGGHANTAVRRIVYGPDFRISLIN